MDVREASERIAAIAAPEGPGFIRSNDSKTKSYAFYWVNEAGQVILISKIYRTARSRNKAQQQLQSGEYQLKPIRIEDQYGYQVVNGGDKIMSAGPLFATEAKRDAALRTLPSSLRPAEEKPADSVAKDKTQRHSFRLNFYRPEDQGSWQGRISYPLTESKESFQGIDTARIEQFIRSVLKESVDTADSSTRQSKSKATAASVERREATVEVQQQPLSIVAEGRKVAGGALGIGTPVGIEVELDPKNTGRNYRIQVFAKALHDGHQIQLDSMSVNRGGDNVLRMPIHTGSLTAGLYRLNAEIIAADTGPKDISRATSLVHFY